MKKIAAAAIMALGLSVPAQAADPKQRIEWNKPMKPFHIIDNTYYVGTQGISVYLIATLQGFILTDGGLPQSAAQIEANIKTLGFSIKDVKIILNSSADFDHAGGLARLKRDSGAELIASAAGKSILEKGRVPYGQQGENSFAPVKVDRTVKDGDTVDLGGVTLTAHLTPGCANWTMSIAEGKDNHNVIFFCSLTVGDNPPVGNKAYPAIAADTKAGFAKLKAMEADIFLASTGEQMDLAKKAATLAANTDKKMLNAPNPFIDKAEFHRVVGQMEKQFDDELAKEQAAKKP